VADLRRIQESCRASLPTPTPTPPPLPTSTPTPTGPDPEEISAARRALEAALDGADAAREDFERLTSRRDAAAILRQDLTLRAAIDDAASSLATAREASAADDPDALLGAADVARGAGDAYRRAKQRVDALLASAAPPAVQPTPTPTSTPRPTLAPVPPEPQNRRWPELETAAAAWLEGRTAEVVAALEVVPASSDRATAVALLLRSAARWSLWREGGERDTELRVAALEDVRRCRVTDPDVAPFADVFPPGFIAFFASGTP
jgi:hypothetical protein